MERLHATIYGLVQGVSFRFYSSQRARELGLVGWIRNLPDGSVETIAEGGQIELNTFLAFLHVGPSGAQVSQVEFEWHPPTAEFSDFSIRM